MSTGVKHVTPQIIPVSEFILKGPRLNILHERRQYSRITFEQALQDILTARHYCILDVDDRLDFSRDCWLADRKRHAEVIANAERLLIGITPMSPPLGLAKRMKIDKLLRNIRTDPFIAVRDYYEIGLPMYLLAKHLQIVESKMNPQRNPLFFSRLRIRMPYFAPFWFFETLPPYEKNLRELEKMYKQAVKQADQLEAAQRKREARRSRILPRPPHGRRESLPVRVRQTSADARARTLRQRPLVRAPSEISDDGTDEAGYQTAHNGDPEDGPWGREWAF